MSSRCPGRFVAILAGAALLAACGGRSPSSPAAVPAATLPASHPPINDMVTPAARLPATTVLAVIGTESITAGDVDAALAGMSNADRLGYTTPEAVRELVEMLADRRLMVRAARAAGLDRDPTLAAMLAAPPAGTSPDQILADAWLAGELTRNSTPAPAEVENYYRAHPLEFTEPARVRVTRVTTPSATTAAALHDQLARGATVAALRADSRVRSVEELWLYDAPKAPATTVAALALEPGMVSTVLPAADHFVVMRAEQAAPARLRDIAEVRVGIASGLESQHREAALADLRGHLRKGVIVIVDTAAVATFAAPPAPAGAQTDAGP